VDTGGPVARSDDGNQEGMPDSRPFESCDYVAVDIETTGCCPGDNSIIEIGAARVENGVVVDVFSQLVAAEEPIPHTIVQLTGITEQMLEGAPHVGSVVSDFRDFVGDAILLAHNHRFDMSFLDYEAEQLGHGPFQRPVLDTLSFARRLAPDAGKYNLRVLAERYEVSTQPNHRASQDALATAEVFVKMWPGLMANGATTVRDLMAVSGAEYQHVLAGKLPLAVDLPAAPGVYVMRDAEGSVIFVGSAKNLRMTVRNAFYVTSDSERLAQATEAESVAHVECASELEAILLESRLVRRYRPRHNDLRGRWTGQTCVIHADTDSAFPTIRVAKKSGRHGLSIGPFTSRVAADRAVEQLREVYGLRRCNRKIPASAPDRECRHRESGACPSPCISAIDTRTYRKRFNEALRALDGGAPAFRDELRRRVAKAEKEHGQDHVTRLRDALRAFDRVAGTLGVLEGARAEGGVVLVGASESRVTLQLLRGGRAATTLRVSRAETSSDAFRASLVRALQRTFFSGRDKIDPVDLRPAELRDLFVIAKYRRERRPVEIPVGSNPEHTADAVLAALDPKAPTARTPRRRHVVS
jgi:DNA polymerase-3 subunit epsilon